MPTEYELLIGKNIGVDFLHRCKHMRIVCGQRSQDIEN